MAKDIRKKFVLDARAATNHFPGIGRYVSSLAQAMVGELETNEVLVLLLDGTQPSPWQLPSANDQVQHEITAVSPFSLSQQWRIPRIFRQQQVTTYHSPYYLMPYKTPVPAIFTVHDLIPQLFPAYFSAQTRLMVNFATWMAIHTTAHIISVSVATRKDVLARYNISSDRITAVPHAADPRFTPQSPAAIAQGCQEYQLPADYVLYLGINKPHKNLVRLVEAWAQVYAQKKAMPSLVMPSLVIAGAWDKRYPEVKERAQSLLPSTAVRFLGPVADTDLPALYSGARFFIFPSLYEGFGLPVIEAMACGTAVITSDISSLPEIAGDAALYVNPQETADIARQIMRFLDNPGLVTEYQQKSRAQARQFSWQNTAVATLNIYRQFI